MAFVLGLQSRQPGGGNGQACSGNDTVQAAMVPSRAASARHCLWLLYLGCSQDSLVVEMDRHALVLTRRKTYDMHNLGTL